jgi:hypothetical protein
METKMVLAKQKRHAFRKDIYLLGQDEDGRNYWLEAPSWDCSWYWGFGYVETYTNNKSPKKSRDILSHEHIDSSFMGSQEVYNHEKQCFVKGEYIHNIYDSPRLVKTTFTSDEGWKLSELFEQFYLLRKMAEFTHKEKPGCNVTTSPVNHGKMSGWNEHINEFMIPMITAEIMRILSPEPLQFSDSIVI